MLAVVAGRGDRPFRVLVDAKAERDVDALARRCHEADVLDAAAEALGALPVGVAAPKLGVGGRWIGDGAGSFDAQEHGAEPRRAVLIAATRTGLCSLVVAGAFLGAPRAT